MVEDKQDLGKNYSLVTNLQKGDHAAFEEIFYLYCGPLKSFAIQELKSEGLAEDAVQEIFCKLWLHRKKLNPTLSLRGFLFTCLKNHILNVVRTRHNEMAKNYRFAYRQSSSANSTEQEVLSNEIQQDIHQLLNQLPELKKNILQLSLYKGLTNEQIAQKLNVSTNTVKMYLSQSSRQLRHLLQVHSVKLFVLTLLNL